MDFNTNYTMNVQNNISNIQNKTSEVPHGQKNEELKEKSLVGTAIQKVRNPSSNSITSHNRIVPVTYKNQICIDKMVQSVANEQINHQREMNGPRIQPGFVKGPHYSSNGEKKDEKVHSIYTKVNFYEVDGKNMMEVTKFRGKEKITRIYQEKKKLGAGGFGTAYLYEHVPNSINERQSKAKVVKVANERPGAKKAMVAGDWVLKEQHKHPVTNETLMHVPGLMSEIKIVVNKGAKSVQALYNKGDLTGSLGKLPPNEMIRATSQLVFGLNHLHTETEVKPGRIHRDIKPENIFHRTDNAGNFEYALADADGAHKSTDLKPSYTYTPGYFSSKDEDISDNKVGVFAKLKFKLTGKKPQTYEKLSDADKMKFNKAHDVFALGVSLREILAGRLEIGSLQLTELPLLTPMKFSDLHVDKKDLTNEQIAQLKGICKMINSMTESNWQKRCTIEEALSSLHELGVEIPDYQI